LAKDCPSLAKYIGDGLDVILSHEDCIIEGNQGFGLSLLHSPYYPYVTSRDTTASGILSEVGMSPFLIDDIILVLRSFPIRVAGNSGPLANECTWEDVTTYNAYNSSNSKIVPIIEYTSVTQKIRRVGFFDPEIVKLAIKYNQPTKIVLNHVDYLSSTLDRQILNTQLRDIQDSIDRKIDYIGTSRSEIQEINSIIN
jgi:adenylosuccinate synthase